MDGLSFEATFCTHKANIALDCLVCVFSIIASWYGLEIFVI